MSDTDSDVATPREVFYIALCETNTNDEEKGNNSGPVRLKKEEGLQMTAREGEQSRETQRKEKKRKNNMRETKSKPRKIAR